MQNRAGLLPPAPLNFADGGSALDLRVHNSQRVTGFFRDVRYAFRLIRKSPLFAFYMIAPLALGIGLNGAIFVLVDALLLRPLPVKKPDELVRLVEVIQNLGPRGYYAYDAVEALENKSTSFSEIIAYEDENAALRDSSGVSRVRCQVVTGNFFTALGVQPLYGRVLTSADALAPVSAPPVVLSFAYWRREFRGDANVIGKTLTLEDRPFTIVGVMPQYFNGLDVETTPDIRLPLIAGGLTSRRNPDADAYRKRSFYSVAARLRPGVTLGRAQAESASIVQATKEIQEGRRLRDEHLEILPAGKGVSILRPKFASALVLLMSGVGLLLVMICANAGGLLLARASVRREEMAVRLAIGATAGRLTRQWLTESLVLTGIGGLAGMCVAFAATPLMLRSLPVVRDLGATVLTLSLDLRPDIRVYGFMVLTCVVCAFFAGIPAAIGIRRANLHESLKTARGTSRQSLRWTLVAVQIGLCTFLLAGAGLLVSTFRHLRATDPGFDRDHVITFSIDPGMAQYKPDQNAALQVRLLAAVRELPGVRAAGTSVIGLMRGVGMKTTVAPEGQIARRSDFLNTSVNQVSSGYFEALGMDLLAGRNFRANEPETKPTPVIVNRAFVRRFFPPAAPIGQKFGAGIEKIAAGDHEIIGVVSDAKYRSLREPVPPTMYTFGYTDPVYVDPFILHVRTSNRPETAIPAVRRALNAIDPRLPFLEVRTLAQEVDATLWAERLLAWLAAVFAGAAAVLATLGVYATLAYAIAQSRREIGIRVALGARAVHVLRLFSARPMWFALLGVALGLAGFYAARPAFQSVLYDVSPGDPATLLSAVAGVLLIALAATLVAVSGALGVDPGVVLRDE